MALKDTVKLSLRISATNTIYDTEIDLLIAGAKAFMTGAGVPDSIVNPTEPITDPEIQENYNKVEQLVYLWVKNYFGYDVITGKAKTSDNDLPQSFQVILNQLKHNTEVYEETTT